MAQVRDELEVPDGFPDGVLAAADEAAKADAWRRDGRPDRTAVELVTIDPPGSRDLDRAFGAARRSAGGFRVWYAIADVASFVEPGGAVDAECHLVGERFEAAVVDVDDDHGERASARVQVQLREPAVIARARDDRGSRPGDEIEVVLRAADPVERRVDLEVV